MHVSKIAFRNFPGKKTSGLLLSFSGQSLLVSTDLITFLKLQPIARIVKRRCKLSLAHQLLPLQDNSIAINRVRKISWQHRIEIAFLGVDMIVGWEWIGIGGGRGIRRGIERVRGDMEGERERGIEGVDRWKKLMRIEQERDHQRRQRRGELDQEL